MSVIFPGLLAESASAVSRVFVGQSASLSVERRLLPNMTAVYPWYSSRKRVREQGNEFIELDLAAGDGETFMRYSHVFYTRRVVHNDAIDALIKQLDAKAPKEVSPAIAHCLKDCLKDIDPRLKYEMSRLEDAKANASSAYRRELDCKASLDAWDLLCMMRCVEEDDVGSETLEAQSKAYFPSQLAEEVAVRLAELVIPSELRKPSLDKKDAKLWNKAVPPSYDKSGCVPLLRPADFVAYMRFFGEKVAGTQAQPVSNFHRALWGHVFRRLSLQPGILQASTMLWTNYSGLISGSEGSSQLPFHMCQALSKQHNSFSALKFANAQMYTLADRYQTEWRNEQKFVPMVRLAPLVGQPMAEDIIAQNVVDKLFVDLKLSPEVDSVDAHVVRRIQGTIRDASLLFEQNPETLLRGLQDHLRCTVPALTEEEENWRPNVVEEVPLPLEDDDTMGHHVAEEGNSEGPIPSEFV